MISEPRWNHHFTNLVGLATMGLIAIAAGCSGSDQADDGGHAPDPPSHASASFDPASPSSDAVREILRFGELDGDGPRIFGEIRAIATTQEGHILVFDHFGNELRRFDQEGNHLHSLGATGQGPGEFQSVLGLAVVPSGDIWVVDGRNGRYSIVRDSSVVRTLVRPSRVITRPWVGGFDEAGRLHELATEPQGEGLELTDLILRVNDDGSIASEHPLPRITIPTPTLGQGVMVPVPFQPRVLRAWDATGAVWQAISSEYSVVRIDLAGDTTHVVSLDDIGPPLNSAEQDSLNHAIATAEQRFGVEVATDMRPTRLPILRWISVDDQANLWVCATARDACDELHVHDPDSGHYRIVDLPVSLADQPVPQIRAGLIYGVTEGSMGEPQVFVGRVPPG